jgi:hypothetical protein
LNLRPLNESEGPHENHFVISSPFSALSYGAGRWLDSYSAVG